MAQKSPAPTKKSTQKLITGVIVVIIVIVLIYLYYQSSPGAQVLWGD